MTDQPDRRTAKLIATLWTILAVVCALGAVSCAFVAAVVLLFDDAPSNPGRHWAHVLTGVAVGGFLAGVLAGVAAGFAWRRVPRRPPTASPTVPPASYRPGPRRH